MVGINLSLDLKRPLGLLQKGRNLNFICTLIKLNERLYFIICRIPLERGRELASQYGIGPLLSPLFEFIPNQQAMQSLPNSLPTIPPINGPRPLSAAASFPSVSGPSSTPSYSPAPAMSPSQLELAKRAWLRLVFGILYLIRDV